MLSLVHALVIAAQVQPVARGMPETIDVGASAESEAAPAAPDAPDDEEESAPAQGLVEGPEPATSGSSLAAIEERLNAVEAENAALREEVGVLREDHNFLDERFQRILPLTGRLGGYVDFGFFHVGGDGSGVRPDTGYQNYP